MHLHSNKSLRWATLFLAGTLLAACSAHNTEPQLPGHYSYEHAFNYDMQGNHFDVHETGTMDFLCDGSALDSAHQVYAVTFANGDTATWAFNYISPSRWHLDGDTLSFAGIKDRFRMELIAGNDRQPELAQQIIDSYGSSIDYEYRFHLETLTDSLLQWSFTYRDGHSDTWTFRREEAR